MAWFNINTLYISWPSVNYTEVWSKKSTFAYILITWIFTEVSFRFLYIKKSLGIHNQNSNFSEQTSDYMWTLLDQHHQPCRRLWCRRVEALDFVFEQSLQFTEKTIISHVFATLCSFCILCRYYYSIVLM